MWWTTSCSYDGCQCDSMYMMTVRLPHDYVWCCIVACEELRQHCCVLANFIYQLLLCVSGGINIIVYLTSLLMIG